MDLFNGPKIANDTCNNYYLLTGCEGRTVKYYPRGFEVWTELVRSVRKKRVLSLKHFPEFYSFPKFFENFETILVYVRFQFCLGVESIGQDSTLLTGCQVLLWIKPIKSR